MAALAKRTGWGWSRALPVLGVCVVLLLPHVLASSWLFIANLALIYAVAAVGLNIILGFSGQFSLAHAAFYALGAYTTALLTIKLGAPFWVSLPAGALTATVIGALVAIPALRLGGLFLAMATFAFNQTVEWILLQWVSLTSGPDGLPVPRPRLGTFVFASDVSLYYLALVVASALVVAASRITRSRIGRTLMAVRDSPVAARSLGVDVERYRIVSFVLSAFYAGVAGGLYANVVQFLFPAMSGLLQVTLFLLIVIIGGLGSVAGAVWGAVVLTGVSEVMRSFKAVQEVVYGVLLVLFIVFMPHGIGPALRAAVARLRDAIHEWRLAPLGSRVAPVAAGNPRPDDPADGQR
jgi:branched-chain amino acid transport system permease protein